jgi:hypothetical protein
LLRRHTPRQGLATILCRFRDYFSLVGAVPGAT